MLLMADIQALQEIKERNTDLIFIILGKLQAYLAKTENKMLSKIA